MRFETALKSADQIGGANDVRAKAGVGAGGCRPILKRPGSAYGTVLSLEDLVSGCSRFEGSAAWPDAEHRNSVKLPVVLVY